MGTAHPDRAPMAAWRGGCESVQQMLDQNWSVMTQCQACRVKLRTPLNFLIQAFGPDFSLWNRRPPCRVEGCSGRVVFLGRAPRMSQYRPLEAEWPKGLPAMGNSGYRGPR